MQIPDVKEHSTRSCVTNYTVIEKGDMHNAPFAREF